MSIHAWWHRPTLAATIVALLYTSAGLVADQAGEPKVLFTKTQTSVPIAGHEDYLWGALELKTGPGMVMEPFGFKQGAKWFGELILFPETATKRHTFYLYRVDNLTEQDVLALAKYAKDHSDNLMIAFARQYKAKYIGTPIKWNSDLLYTLARIAGVTDIEKFWISIGLDPTGVPGFLPSDEFREYDSFADSMGAGAGIVMSVINSSESQKFDCVGCVKEGHTAETALYYNDFGLGDLSNLGAPFEDQRFYLAVNSPINGADRALVGEVVSNPLQPSPGVDIAWPEDD